MPFQIALQVGYLPWQGPKTDDVIKGLAAQGHKSVLAVPIAFTSDHVETLFEIDIEYAEDAEKAGLESFIRAPSLNDSPTFIKAQVSFKISPKPSSFKTLFRSLLF